MIVCLHSPKQQEVRWTDCDFHILFAQIGSWLVFNPQSGCSFAHRGTHSPFRSIESAKESINCPSGPTIWSEGQPQSLKILKGDDLMVVKYWDDDSYCYSIIIIFLANRVALPTILPFGRVGKEIGGLCFEKKCRNWPRSDTHPGDDWGPNKGSIKPKSDPRWVNLHDNMTTFEWNWSPKHHIGTVPFFWIPKSPELPP